MPHKQPPASPQPNTSPQTTRPAPKNESPPNIRPCLYATRQWLRETNRPSNAPLTPPTSPTARPATPTYDDYVASSAHDDVRLAPTPTAPQPPPFSPLDMHPHPSHLASPQTPHLAPPPFPAPPAPNAQSQTRRLLPHVHFKTPRGPTANLLNHHKPPTQLREKRRNQYLNISKPDHATPTTPPSACLWPMRMPLYRGNKTD